MPVGSDDAPVFDPPGVSDKFEEEMMELMRSASQRNFSRPYVGVRAGAQDVNGIANKNGPPAPPLPPPPPPPLPSEKAPGPDEGGMSRELKVLSFQCFQ